MRLTPEERLWELNREGASPIEAIKALRAEYGLDIGKGKELLSRHPAYETRHRASEPLRDAAVQALEMEAAIWRSLPGSGTDKRGSTR